VVYRLSQRRRFLGFLSSISRSYLPRGGFAGADDPASDSGYHEGSGGNGNAVIGRSLSNGLQTAMLFPIAGIYVGCSKR
jgi:hypothetical protein